MYSIRPCHHGRARRIVKLNHCTTPKILDPGIARTFFVAGATGRALYDIDDPMADQRPLDDAQYALDHFQTKLFALPDQMNTAAGRAMALQRLDLMHVFTQQLLAESELSLSES